MHVGAGRIHNTCITIADVHLTLLYIMARTYTILHLILAGSEPVGPTSVTIPSSTFQVTPTTSPTGTGPTGPTGTDDSGTGTPAPKKSFPLYIVIAAVLGAVIFILVVCIMVAFVIFTHKRRLKWKVASNGVVKHGPSTAGQFCSSMSLVC